MFYFLSVPHDAFCAELLHCAPSKKEFRQLLSGGLESPPPGAAMDQRRASRVERHKRTTLRLVNGWCHALKCRPRGSFAPLPAGFADTTINLIGPLQM